MNEEIKEIKTPEQAQEANPAPIQKPKNTNIKPAKVVLTMTGAGSCKIDEFSLKRGESFEVDAIRAERFLASGLFTMKI